jgi:hypothetical protein
VQSVHAGKPLAVVNNNTVQPQVKTVQSLPKMDHTSHVAPIKTPTPQQHIVHAPPPPQVKTVQSLPKMDHTSHVAPVRTVAPQQHTVRTPPPPPPQVHAPPPASHSNASHSGSSHNSGGHGKKGGK